MNLIRFDIGTEEYVLIPRNKIRSIEWSHIPGSRGRYCPVVNGYRLYGSTMEQVLELLDHGA